MTATNVATTNNNSLKKIFSRNFFIKYGLYFIIILMVLALTFSTDKFLTTSNIVSVLRQISMQAIIAVAMTMVIIMGQMDLSVGAIVAFASVINAILLKQGFPIALAVILTLLVSAIWGLINGEVIARYKIHSFLVTLAIQTIIRGVTYTMTSGYPIGGLPKDFFGFGAGYWGIIPYPVIYMAIIYIIGIFVLNWTPFGRSLYAIGGNTEAARLSGIHIERIKISVFIVSALLSAVSGIILSSRLMAGSPETGQGWEMDIIAAVIIGGTNIFGGEGKLTGSLLGMLFIGILTNGMILLGVTPYMQQVVRGLVILAAVVLNSFQKK
jgi:ribose/xylose/arabinose/galactoside ABC-type transport system permease subunit